MVKDALRAQTIRDRGEGDRDIAFPPQIRAADCATDTRIYRIIHILREFRVHSRSLLYNTEEGK